MKQLLLYISLSILFLNACNYAIEDGPSISFIGNTLLLDTIEEDSVFTISYQVKAGSSPVIYTQINNESVIVIDSIINCSDSLTINKQYSFFESQRTGKQTIYIKARDKNDLLAQQQHNIFVNTIKSPSIFFNTDYLHKDTTLVAGSIHTIECVIAEGDRTLDSVFLYENKELLSSANVNDLSLINDTVYWTYNYNADSIGVFDIKAKAQDVVGKYKSVEISVEVK